MLLLFLDYFRHNKANVNQLHTIINKVSKTPQNGANLQTYNLLNESTKRKTSTTPPYVPIPIKQFWENSNYFCLMSVKTKQQTKTTNYEI